MKSNFFRKFSFFLVNFSSRSIKLHITNKCNLACKTCYNESTEGPMDSSHIFSLLDQLKNRKWRLDILGGEPLIREDFFEIIFYAKKKALIKTIQVFTNATLIDKGVAERMKKSGVDVAIVPLYSHIKEIHDDITRCPGSWLKTVEGIRFLVNAGIRTYSFIIFMSCNSDRINELESFARSLGTKPIFFPYIKQSISDDLCVNDKTKYQQLVNYSFKNSARHRNLTLAGLECRSKACHAFVKTIAIKADGTVTPCPFVDLNLGNIKQSKLYSILLGAYRNTELLNFLSIPEECCRCTCVDVCGGGCKAPNYRLYNDAKHKDSNCSGPYREKNFREKIGEYIPYFF